LAWLQSDIGRDHEPNTSIWLDWERVGSAPTTTYDIDRKVDWQCWVPGYTKALISFSSHPPETYSLPRPDRPDRNVVEVTILDIDLDGIF
tara:strand:+ start:4519 stop:4788 length:270 start_codon:yes stop_codon:yes gene_type:complete